METFMREVSDALGVTADVLKEMYPLIREQFMWNRVALIVIVFLGIIGLLSLVTLFTCEDDEDAKLSIVSAVSFLTCALLIVIALIVRVTLAPDYLFIIQILDGL